MAEDVVEITYLVSEEARRAPEEFVAEDVPENHVVSEDVGMLTGVTELVLHQTRSLCLYHSLSCLQFRAYETRKHTRLTKSRSS